VSVRRLSSHSRGQGLVEFALILPLLAIFLVMAVDAGRLFFGWVALQNASRIGADYAAGHAEAWDGSPAGTDQNVRDHYVLVVRGDLQALGCQGNPVPDPNFDPDGDGTSDFTEGALVRIELDCDFGLLTPLAESFLGAPLTLHSRSDFAINRTRLGGVPPPAGNPPPPVSCATGEARVPDLVGERNEAAWNRWVGAGFSGANYAPQVAPSNKNRIVSTQSLDAGTCEPVTAAMAVTL
jgi:hypothetical protein